MANVYVNNLCSWPLYFKRATGQGDISIPGGAKKYPLLSFEEALAQIQLGNKMFTGDDGMGSHARIQIVDDAQRRELFGLPEEAGPETAPVLMTEETVRELLGQKTKAKFHAMLKELVHTDAEKKNLVQIAFNVGAEEKEAWKVDALRELAEDVAI